MTIGSEELKKFFLQWFLVLRKVETEALVYRHVVEVCRTISPDLVRDVEAKARKNPKLLKMLEEKYSQLDKSSDSVV